MPSPSVTYSFVNGAVADASQVNTNFTDVINSLTDSSKDLLVNALSTTSTITSNGLITANLATARAITCTSSGISVSGNGQDGSFGGIDFQGNQIICGNAFIDSAQNGLFIGMNCLPSATDSEIDPIAASPVTFIALDGDATSGSFITFGEYQAGGTTSIAPEDTLKWGVVGSGLRADLFSGTDSWQDYLATSTIVGWGTPTGTIYYKRIGCTVFVDFNITGTSDAVTASFTVPYAPALILNALCNGTDNTVALDNPSIIYNDTTDSVIHLYLKNSSHGWTASGTKEIKGQFIYQCTATI